MAKKIIHKQQIFDTGIRLAQTLPLGEVTVSTLCTELGIVKTTFYRQYRSLKDMYSDILLLSSKEVTRQLPSILLEEKSNMEKILNLWDIATSSIVEYGPRVLSYVLQFDGKYYGAKHFFSKDPFWSVMKKLIKHAQLAGEINNLSDPEILFYIIHTFFVGNNLGWASCDGTYDYTTYLHIGIQYILGDIHIDHDSLDIHRNRIQELLDTSESGITIL